MILNLSLLHRVLKTPNELSIPCIMLLTNLKSMIIIEYKENTNLSSSFKTYRFTHNDDEIFIPLAENKEEL